MSAQSLAEKHAIVEYEPMKFRTPETDQLLAALLKGPCALTRFMAVPDDFVLPVRRGDACRILGNGVPPPVARRIVEGLISALAVAP